MAQAVAVQHVAFQQVGHGGQANVGVAAHVGVGLRRQGHGAKVVKEHKGAHGALGHGGQHAAHGEGPGQLAFMAGQAQQLGHAAPTSWVCTSIWPSMILWMGHLLAISSSLARSASVMSPSMATWRTSW